MYGDLLACPADLAGDGGLRGVGVGWLEQAKPREGSPKADEIPFLGQVRES